MSPETKLKLAKMMGKEVKPVCHIINGDLLYYGYEVETEWSTETIEFNPETNAEQLLECVEFLLDSGCHISKDGRNYWVEMGAPIDWPGGCCSDIFKEAVLKALTAIVEEV